MRRIAIGVAVVGGAFTVARVLAPRVHARMLATCQRMFEHMPDDFPPKRIMLGVEETRATTARILELLEERTHAEEATPQGKPLWTTAEEIEVIHA